MIAVSPGAPRATHRARAGPPPVVAPNCIGGGAEDPSPGYLAHEVEFTGSDGATRRSERHLARRDADDRVVLGRRVERHPAWGPTGAGVQRDRACGVKTGSDRYESASADGGGQTGRGQIRSPSSQRPHQHAAASRAKRRRRRMAACFRGAGLEPNLRNY